MSKKTAFGYPGLEVLLFIIILGVGVIVRAWTIGYAAPWIDEIHSLLYARNPVAHLIDITRTTDIHPPLYFLSVKAWGALFGESREAARMLSLVLGVTCIGLVFVIARRLFDAPTAFVAMAFFATFPTAVHYAREIRMYPLLTTLFLLSFVCFLKLYQSGSAQGGRVLRPLAALGFALCLALAFYTHYTAAILFMLYTLAGLWSLIRGNRTCFLWTFSGLALATIIVTPQMVHLFSSSLGDPDKSWMEATTWSNFYSISMGAYPYDKVLKLFIFAFLMAGFFLVWRRDRSTAGLIFFFTGGGMLLAAGIGVYEPMYLVRTIQIYTVFASLLVALVVMTLPRSVAVIVGLGLIGANLYTVVQNEYLAMRETLTAEQIGPLVSLLDPKQDRVFAKAYLHGQMTLLHVPLFDIASELTHEAFETSLAEIEAQAACVGPDIATPCRSVVIVIEKESRFNVQAIAAWNDMADDLKQRYPSHSEHLLSGYRTLVLSSDPAFLAQIDEVL